MNKNTLDILNSALQQLEAMSSQEVQKRTSDLGIVIPEEPKLSDLLNHFIFDFDGFFAEIINSKKSEWYNIGQIKRKNIDIENKRSHQKVALSF